MTATDSFVLVATTADGKAKVIRTYVTRRRADQDADLLSMEASNGTTYTVEDVEHIDD